MLQIVYLNLMLKKYVVSWCDKMDQRLIDFIKKHVEIGSDILMVKELLLNAGHDIYIVEEHINHVLRDKKVKEFIVKHVKIGTDIERIKQALLDAGYDIKIVEEHIEHALKLKKKIRNINILLAVSLLTLFSKTLFLAPKDGRKIWLLTKTTQSSLGLICPSALILIISSFSSITIMTKKWAFCYTPLEIIEQKRILNDFLDIFYPYQI